MVIWYNVLYLLKMLLALRQHSFYTRRCAYEDGKNKQRVEIL